MMLRQSIDIQAPAALIYDVAHDVSRWASMLPHYRYVRVLERNGDDCICEMGARRDFVPVRWTAAVHLLPQIPRIEFTHVNGPTTGMRVAWIFDPTARGTRLTISHDLATLSRPLVRTALGAHIAARLFIEPIASRTLACIKAIAEERHG
ncbi:MAG TPA: SRPBCC family protein [Candidatus Acidoferrales bacterium]|nr:SRPBCC family protein [Candidatus Acidoferrales bacterium]